MGHQLLMSKLLTTIFVSTLAPGILGCGESDVVSRIVGGNPAVKHSIPWQAALVSKGWDDPFCGGTIINSNHILTAAHCTRGRTANGIQVKTGEHDVTQPDGDTTHNVKKIINHPSYNSATVDYDFAILEIDCVEKIDLTDKARAACLPEIGDTAKFEQDVDGTEFDVSGWGDRGGSQGFPDILHVVTVPFVSDATCKSSYGSSSISKRMICAGNTINGGVDSCQGDSGGPMTWMDNVSKKWKVVGVVSWGAGCADKDYPGVYAEVESVLKWVKDNSDSVCETEPTTEKPSTEKPTTEQPTEKPTEPPPDSSDCGIDVFDQKIIGGDEAVKHSIPWQAALVSYGSKNPFCGGTIIDATHILTAAHCTEGETSGQIQVVTGEHDVTKADGDTVHDVIKIIDHPNYDSYTLDYDYSILEIDCDYKIKLNDIARAACLPDPGDTAKFEQAAKTDFNVSGWGNTGDSFPDVLNVVTVPFVKHAICKNKYPPGEITKRMICAGNTKIGGVDSCQGDSGGPLTWKDTGSGRWKIVGVVSWGYGCAEKQYPGVYAEVEEVLNWVKSNSGEDCGLEPPVTEPPTCKDKLPKWKCNRIKRKGKCNKPRPKKKCQKTCGHC